MFPFIQKIFRTNGNQVAELTPLVEEINALEPSFKELPREKFPGYTEQLKQKISQGQILDEILPQAFALVREAARQTVGMRPYDVQLIAGIILHQGKIAEQKTGEGKTLSATLPLYLNALTGQGAHLVTVNDYLARRDTEWMGPLYSALGLTVGCLNHQTAYLYDPEGRGERVDISDPEGSSETTQESLLGKGKYLRPVSRREAYQADITYGTNNEFGFDYLRDNMARSFDQIVQTNPQKELGAHHFAIVDEVDFLLIDQARTPLIISAPMKESKELYQKFTRLVPQLPAEYYDIDEKRKSATLTELGIAKMEKKLGVDNLYANFELVHHLEQAIKAHKLFQKDRDYIVQDGQVIIVDEFTGRLMPGRRYSEGLHQAIEAKENVPIQKESKTLATISFQNYFRMYDKLAGMTGTAATEAEEFNQIYHLDVAVIPTNKPVIRQDHPDRIYKHQRVKYSAIVQEVKERHQAGQPVLIGTTSVEKNELVAKLLQRNQIPHEILNAKNHQREAEIIAKAGQKGAVTVATNLAGRGTDIKLDDEVKKLGGLHVIGTERHEARRIDNQLRGRAGRQGDPGSSRFYVALDDDLMRIFGGERIAQIMERFNFPEDMPIEHPLISKQIESAQKKVEGYNFDIRKHLVEYDDVINRQREIIYTLRRNILDGQNLRPRLEEIYQSPSPEESPQQPFGPDAFDQYQEKQLHLGENVMRDFERQVYLTTIDQLWTDHIDALDELRRGIQLRGYAQKDPLVEFKNEAYQMFQQLMDKIDTEAAQIILHAEVIPQQSQIKLHDLQARQEKLRQPQEPGTPSEPTTTQPYKKSPQEEIGRNDPCPCGSGKKYKQCCGEYS